jgi:hypothetical protein
MQSLGYSHKKINAKIVKSHLHTHVGFLIYQQPDPREPVTASQQKAIKIEGRCRCSLKKSTLCFLINKLIAFQQRMFSQQDMPFDP